MEERYMLTPPRIAVGFLCQRSARGYAIRLFLMAIVRIIGVKIKLKTNGTKKYIV